VKSTLGSAKHLAKKNWSSISPTAVNFINVKHARFLYERHFGSFCASVCTDVHKKAAETTFVQKIPAFNVDEIDT
jgi:hypothetical protein